MSDSEKNLLRLLCISVYEGYLSTLHGCDVAARKDLGRFYVDVRPGDLVMERSTAWMPERDEHRFGRLLRTERRPVYTPEEWAAQGAGADEPVPTDLYWVIQRFDGSEYNWNNADFLRVPEVMTGVGERRARTPTPGTTGTANNKET